jgi:hypothetical protein
MGQLRRIAYAAVRKKRGGAMLSRVHEQDDPQRREVVALDDEFAEVAAQIREVFVRKMDRGCVEVAFQASTTSTSSSDTTPC